MEDSSSHSQLMVTPAFEGWFMSHQRSSVMKWLLNILLSSLLSCLSGAICAVPVGRVGSRGGLQALHVLHPWTHAHIINVWMCACPFSLVCVKVPGPLRAGPMENWQQSQGRFCFKRNEELSSLSTHTQHVYPCLSKVEKLKTSDWLKGSSSKRKRSWQPKRIYRKEHQNILKVSCEEH